MHIVYKTTNLINSKIYVGVSNGKNKNYLGSGIALKRAIEKYGWDSFERTILFECTDGDEAYWLERIIINKEFIKFHDCYNAKVGGYSGYFHTEETRKKISESKIGKPRPPHVIEMLRKLSKERTGKKHPMWGKHHSKETKEKLRKINLGKKHSKETKEKVRKSNIGKKLSPEHIEILRIVNTGKKHSEETKRKISENNSQCKSVTIIVNNEPLLTFRSIAEASRLTGYHENSIRHVVKGRTKTTGQWIGDKFIKVKWKYKNRT